MAGPTPEDPAETATRPPQGRAVRCRGLGWAPRRRAPAILTACVLALAACSGEEVPGAAVGHGDEGGPVAPPPVPAGAGAAGSGDRCLPCHAEVVARYRGSHGMAASLGAVADLTPGRVTNPGTGTTYEVHPAERGGVLVGVRADGGRREQQIVGRLGAGIFDTSLVAVERAMGRVGGRLAFAPVEYVTGHGWALSPFEVFGGGAGLDQPVASECLVCHTDTDVADLPGAAVPRGPDGRPRPGAAVFPRQHLGADALQHLQPLGCEACHGDLSAHLARMEARAPGAPAPAPDELGLVGWRDLPVARRREVCARCHLEGEARVALGGLEFGLLSDDRPLLGRRPVLVTAAPDDDYRFVGQVERLALSPCFTGSPGMTCLTCHRPHAGVATQGTASFDRACLRCHGAGAGCSRPPGLDVASVTGEPARTEEACVDCHVRRSQPYDLPHVRTADHFIRRTIPPPATPAPRPFHDLDGELRVFRDGVVDERLATPAGRRWERGVRAFGFVKQGRLERAAELLEAFPAPGSPQALTPTAPAGLVALETSAVFHGMRGHVLELLGDHEAALAAYTDALTIDPADPEARLNRASLRVTAGDLRGAVEDTSHLLERHPLAEKAWNTNARAAAAAGDLASALEALGRSAEIWPSDPAVHHEAGRLLLRMGDARRARLALQRAAELQPSRPGLAADLAAARR